MERPGNRWAVCLKRTGHAGSSLAQGELRVKLSDPRGQVVAQRVRP